MYLFKKADIILAILLIAAGLAMSYFFSFGQSAGDTLLVAVDGRKFGSWSLLEDKEIVIEQKNHINKVTIKGGIVSMSFSDCYGQDCVQHAGISRTGQTIICLPNKVVAEITGGAADYDSIAK